ncbi:hemerythrin domain-containing protein [Neptuniibacter sp.]|uniref:bacteriohemerythrin n=1 Tax=Neptuniibacter sp. TaxID=1962643 RepID=UPI00261DED35|nr:hemerythrin domain-containing protein [Neptuniibacter sp.]MCP4596631.1 hemerythrin [Neptuniibacter sp.]
MIKIQWDKKFELGHERIDFEHRIFLDLIKSVSQLASDKERALRLLREVEKYAEFHFISEENLMLDTGYPDYSSHKEEHQILLATLKEKSFEYRHDQLSLEELSDFLFQWFALHTTQVDSKLTQYISR